MNKQQAQASDTGWGEYLCFVIPSVEEERLATGYLTGACWRETREMTALLLHAIETARE